MMSRSEYEVLCAREEYLEAWAELKDASWWNLSEVLWWNYRVHACWRRMRKVVGGE
jgi:hypothetical protein